MVVHASSYVSRRIIKFKTFKLFEVTFLKNAYSLHVCKNAHTNTTQTFAHTHTQILTHKRTQTLTHTRTQTHRSLFMTCASSLTFELKLENNIFLDISWELPKINRSELVPCAELGILVVFEEGEGGVFESLFRVHLGKKTFLILL